MEKYIKYTRDSLALLQQKWKQIQAAENEVYSECGLCKSVSLVPLHKHMQMKLGNCLRVIQLIYMNYNCQLSQTHYQPKEIV